MIKCVCNRKSGRAASDDSNSLAAPYLRDHRLYISLCVSLLDDISLIIMDSNGIAVFSVDTSLLAQCRTYPSREFREIAGLVQSHESLSVIFLVDLFVPLRDKIVQRAACDHTVKRHCGLAERHTAIHAPCSLSSSLLYGYILIEFSEIIYSFFRRNTKIFLSLIFHKTCCLAHGLSLLR
ncbi:MAG: hypothetical protein BWY61_02045 [Firmicutes bacterium ADurb.Bin354]|nr:MAG: hypothetical protein BWY61_02045 [Firmicutes bacterium ADurb.Bin354]